MTFSLTLSAPLLRELSITARTMYLEIGRFSLFGTIWDMPATSEPWLHISRHQVGVGLEVRLGPFLLSAGIDPDSTKKAPEAPTKPALY